MSAWKDLKTSRAREAEAEEESSDDEGAGEAISTKAMTEELLDHLAQLQEETDALVEHFVVGDMVAVLGEVAVGDDHEFWLLRLTRPHYTTTKDVRDLTTNEFVPKGSHVVEGVWYRLVSPSVARGLRPQGATFWEREARAEEERVVISHHILAKVSTLSPTSETGKALRGARNTVAVPEAEMQAVRRALLGRK